MPVFTFRLLFRKVKIKMAEALVETIPCEHCNIQINLEDWTEHIVSH